MKRLLLLSFSLLAGATLAFAQDRDAYPDMRGQWKGKNEGVVLGAGPHHREGGSTGEPRVVSKEFTVAVKGQEGRRFWGEIISADDRGPFLAVFGNDRQAIHAVDHAGGILDGKLVQPGRFELCYLRGGRDAMVAACNVLTKE